MLNKLDSLRSASVSEEGFTLIELIIVVVIIGILAAIAIPMFLNQQKGAIQAGVKSDVRNANTAVATALVKSPTAKAVRGVIVGSNVTGITAINPVVATGVPIDIKSLSDDNSVLFIGSAASINVAGVPAAANGAWNNYAIKGYNTEAGTDSLNAYTYAFTSTTGKSVEGSTTIPVVPAP